MDPKESSRLLNFGDRLAVDRALKDLAQAHNAYELDEKARKLAEQGMPALKALLRHLDTGDPALRGGLGHLARHLDAEMVIPALRRAAMDTSRSDAARLTAVMILERYLGQDIDPELAQRIPASYDVARESGEEAIAIAETDPLVLVEYAEQLLNEPPEIIRAVLQIVKDMEDPRRARLLLAVAAYGEPSLQKDILAALGAMRHPLALQALYILRRLAAPELHPLAQRQIQKLRMAGVPPLPAGQLRALWSPLNAQGHSILWVIHQSPQNEARVDLLTLILHDQWGVVYAEAYPNLEAEELPRPAAMGTVHQVRMVDGHHQVLLAEIKPPLALSMLDQALEHLAQTEAPWPGELVVFGHWLWNQETPSPQPVPWPRLPAAASELSQEESLALLDHPAFAGWVWVLPEFETLLAQHSQKEISKGGPIHQQVVQLLLEDPHRSQLSARLLQQARWFKLAGHSRNAARVLAIRDGVEQGESQHPFLQELAWRSLITAAADRAMRRTLHLLRK